jgi:hypothetical protein
VWGKELATPGLRLDTTGGPSWKPLPVLFTTAFAPLAVLHDGLPPALWLVVARAGGLLALVLAFRLAARLAGPECRTARTAGALAALALALSPQWLRYLAHGNEAPLAAALMLWSLERHLDGARGQSVALAVLACMLRPEAFPFLAAYALWLWFREPWRQPAIAGWLVALPLVWVVPEWIGSGEPLSAGRQATSEPSWSLSHADRPWLAALERAHGLAGVPLELGALAAVLFAKRRGERATLVLAAGALLWVGLFVAMTQAGFSGNARYVLPALVAVCLLAGVGAARLAEAAARRAALRERPAAAAWVVALVLLLVAAAPQLSERVADAGRQARVAGATAELQHDLGRAVRAVGGADAVRPAGPATVNRAFHTRLAWELEIPISQVELGRGQGVVFHATTPISRPPPVPSRGPPARLLARVGDWQVLGGGRVVYTELAALSHERGEPAGAEAGAH